MEWIVATIVFGILFLLSIGYGFLWMTLSKKKEKEAYQKGGSDTFDWILKAGYEQRVQEFRLYNEKVEPGQVVFVGDSLTENFNLTECFPTSPYRLYNRGIGGDTTEGLKKRLRESVFDLSPKAIVLLIGINDFALFPNATPESVAASIQEVVKRIQTQLPKAKILLEALYPVHSTLDPKIDAGSVGNKNNEDILKTNEIIAKIKGVHFLDLGPILRDENGELKLEYTREGLHLNATGYFAIVPTLEKAMEEAMKE